MPETDGEVPPRAERGLRLRLAAARTMTWAMAQTGDPVARLLHAPWRNNPYPVYERLRAAGPLARSRLGLRALTGHALCDSVLRDRRFGVRAADGNPGDPRADLVDLHLSLLELDPPDHTRLRRLAAPAFRPRRLERFRDRIEHTAAELLEAAGERGKFDLVRDFAAPLPIRVIADLLGLPQVNAERLAHHGAVLGGALDGIRSLRQIRRMQASTAELESMLTDLIDQKRHQPGEDIVSDLVAALDDDELTATELVQLCQLLLLAGFETTVNLIGNGTLAMLNHPEQWQRLVDEPSLAGAVVDETLRWDPPVQATARIAQEPVELAGRTIRPNSMVLLLLGAAGRDPDVHRNPARFDITRQDRAGHLAFSSGIHYCLGAPLARLEAEIAFRTLAERMPRLHRAGRPSRRPTTIIHGLSALPVSPGAGHAHHR